MATIKKASAMSCAIYIAATRDTYSSANSWRVDLRFEMTEANRSAMKAGLDIPSTEAWPSKLGRIRLRDLGARIYVGSDWAMACGESLRYSEVYGIELRDAEIMAHTLKSIERALHKVREKYGSPADVGAWLRRLCEVTGVTEVHFSSEACALMAHPGQPDRAYDPSQADYQLRGICEKHCRKESQSA